MDGRNCSQRLKKRESKKRHASKWNPYSKKHVRLKTNMKITSVANENGVEACYSQKKKKKKKKNKKHSKHRY